MGKKQKELEIFVTGLTKEESDKLRSAKNKRPANCYLCRREEGKESTTVGLNDNVLVYHPIEMGLIKKRVTAKKEAFIINYFICKECAVLLGIQKDLIIE